LSKEWVNPEIQGDKLPKITSRVNTNELSEIQDVEMHILKNAQRYAEIHIRNTQTRKRLTKVRGTAKKQGLDHWIRE